MILKETLLSSTLINKLSGDLREDYAGVSIDTRSMVRGDIFVAIHGESFDGSDFVDIAVNKKASLLILNTRSKKKVKHKTKIPMIFVENTINYLQEIAKHHLKLWKRKKNNLTIGITGSNGKTTQKEMLFHILNLTFPEKIHKTIGNYNNHIGVPLTLLKLEEKHIVSIVEMGSNHPGEIKYLCDIVSPDAGLITNIGFAHLEFFKDLDGVFDEKSSLFDAVKEKKHAKFVICDDDPYLAKLAPNNVLTSFGENSLDIRVRLHDNCLVINFGQNLIEIENKYILGKNNLKNLAQVLLLAIKLFPEKQLELIEACSSFRPSQNRGEIIKKDGKVFFLDAYNANPSSMLHSMESFIDHLLSISAKIDNCLFILGDMNEIGSQTEKMHAQIGDWARTKNIKNIAFVGRYAKYYKGLSWNGPKIYESVDELIKEKEKLLLSFEYFFIKGSRTVQLERFIL